MTAEVTTPGASCEQEDPIAFLATVVERQGTRLEALSEWATKARQSITQLENGAARFCSPLHGQVPSPEQMCEFFKAFSAWQATSPTFTKDQTATVRGETSKGVPYEYSYNYADLAAVLSLAHTASTHGLSVFQVQVAARDVPVIRSYIVHSSGGFIWADAPIIIKSSRGDRGGQDWAAASTLARRYSLCMVLGVAAAEDDSDGIAPSDGGGSGRGGSESHSTGWRDRRPQAAANQPPRAPARPPSAPTAAAPARTAPPAATAPAAAAPPATARPAPATTSPPPAAPGWQGRPPAGATEARQG